MSFNCQVKSIKKLPRKDGELWRGWHKNGELDFVGNKKNNQKTGVWSFFHPNGQKESEGEFVMGEKQGCWIEWYENKKERKEYAFYDKVHIYKWIKLIVSIIFICAVL